jgi:hypothetical protein
VFHITLSQFSVLQVVHFQKALLTKIKATFPVEPTRHHNTARQYDHPSTTTESNIHFAIILRIVKHFISPRIAAHLGPSNALNNIVKYFNLRSSFKVQKKKVKLSLSTPLRSVDTAPLTLTVGTRRPPSTPRPCHFTPGKKMCPLNRGLGEPQSRAGRFGEEKCPGS